MTTELKPQLQTALAALQSGDLSTRATELFQLLGYRSDKTAPLQTKSADELLENYDLDGKFRRDAARVAAWKSVDILFQLTDAEVKDALAGQNTLFQSSSEAYNGKIIRSYLFLAVELEGETWNRGDLAIIVREINKLFPMPALVLFKHGGLASLGVINRRLNKSHADRDVLEKVTLIKDIRLENPHRAHLEILSELSLFELRDKFKVSNFVELDAAWREVTNITELNKRFYRELANWFFYARKHVEFPRAQTDTEKSVAVIRLITRLIFSYFVREKGLVPKQFFLPREIPNLLTDDALKPDAGGYYNAILQNLFFATLATEKAERGWLDEDKKRNADEYLDASKRRYHSLFVDVEAAEKLFDQVPFLNGGLFECLDKREEDENGKPLPEERHDGFSTNPKKRALVPNRLFWGETLEAEAELRGAYNTPKTRFKPIAPLLDVLGRYKFTVAENTPLDEEVALDPELLGKVFENLLAFYNPETTESARKQFGAFFTPREIVSYMIETALAAFLETKRPEIEPEKLRALVSYEQDAPTFTPAEAKELIETIGDITILDPACGSGAFPMGALQHLTFVLKRLDADGKLWEQRQRDQIEELTLNVVGEVQDAAYDAAIARLEQAIALDGGDYVRKLFLIERSMFGIDIQPIAVQIAKLRFFISLVVEQKAPDSDSVQPLPNLETKIVAANALLSFEWPKNRSIFEAEELEALEKKLSDVRRRHFRAQKWRDKKELRRRDKKLRDELRAVLERAGLKKNTAANIAQWDPYDQNTGAKLFHPEWMFGREMSAGFSLVIGNPPYVRADFQGGDFKAMRRAIDTQGDFTTLYEKWDLFIPFIERSVQLLAPDGVATMIVSDAYAHAKYGLKNREWALETTKVLRLDLMSDVKIFEAAVRNVIYFFQRGDGQSHVPLRRLHSADGAITELPSKPQAELTERAFFPSDGDETPFEIETVPLEQICYVSVGMVVNSHEKLDVETFSMVDVVSSTKDEKHPKAFVEGKQLGKWLPNSNNWIEWGTERAPAHFRRKNFEEFFSVREKIIAPRSPGSEVKASFDEQEIHFTESTIGFVSWFSLKYVRNRSIKKSARYQNESPGAFMKREELEQISRQFSVKYLLAVMNSTVAREFLRANRRSNIHLYPDDWKQLPIAVAAPARQALLEQVVNWILTEKHAGDASPRGAVRLAFWQQLADALVWELYYPTEFAQARSVFRALEGSQPAATSGRAEVAAADLPHLLNYFQQVYEPSHPLREAVFFLDSIPSVRAAKG